MQDTGNPGIQLNKYISNAGICSRRQAETFIKNKCVTVNNILVTDPGFRVTSVDLVKFKNKLIKEDKKIYILLNKPKNYITTADDEKGRKTVLDLIDMDSKERIYPVGRLDRATTGLLILTNDGELTQLLAHPSSKVEKSYEVTLDKPLTTEDLLRIKSGIRLDDGLIKVDSISNSGEDKHVVRVTLHSGKNRIVRRIFEYFFYRILKLDRFKYANIVKKSLAQKEWRYLTKKEVANLYELATKTTKTSK